MLREAKRPDEVPARCAGCAARLHGMCGELSTEQLASLARVSAHREASEGARLLDDCQTADSHANILSGVVKLTASLPDGRQQIVGLQFAPDFLGRPGEDRMTLTVEAVTDVVLCTFPKSAVDRLRTASATLERLLNRQTVRELAEARRWMLTLGRRTAQEKVACFLLLIAGHACGDATGESRTGIRPVRFCLPMCRSDIADFLGLTIETVSRQLTRLNADGVIALQHRAVEISDFGRLRALAGD